MVTHYLDDKIVQPFWDNSAKPRLVIDPGDIVVFECLEASGQFMAESTVEDFLNVDRSLIHALNGAVFINDAEPGDALEIEILDLQHKGWGWTGFKAGFGLLSDDFDMSYFHLWKLEGNDCHFGKEGIVVPFEPMAGCVGVAPAESGRFDTMPPRANAGNVDIRDLTVGTKFWLPVFVPGALFSTGDCHASQGQGEVCGTGIECPMTVTMKFCVRKDIVVEELQYSRRNPLPRFDNAGYHGTTAHGPDLYKNAQNAIRYMIAWLCETKKLTREQAFVLCSVAADLQISQIVDAPNWIVSAHMPLGIFKS